MRFALVVLMVCLVGAPPACAGAWLRDKGTAFVATGSTVRRTETGLGQETRLYGDYGLTSQLTLGLDLNQSDALTGHALLFARTPLGPDGMRTRFALELGVGVHAKDGAWFKMAKIALAVGHGFKSGWGDGWISAETTFERRLGLPDPVWKLDMVAGLSSGPRLRPMVKLETYHISGSPFAWSLTPAVMFDTKKGATWVAGIERKSEPTRSTGVTVELWQRF
jgi:hypothetical protein